MTLSALILRAMLAVLCPGASPASRIDLPSCDAECRATTIARTGHRPARGFTWMRARWSGWSRQETEMEGLVRWAGIAEGVARVVADPPPAWRWPAEELGWALITVARHESSFWRSVQEGRLRGPAGEWGLWQCYPTLPGCGRALTGLDADAVERAARFAAEQLARARGAAGHCDWWLPDMLTVYASGKSCHVRWDTLDERVATFGRIASAEMRGAPLPIGALLALAEVR
jgi:hypothetical protein